MEGKWMIRVYRSGAVVEKSKFWVPISAKPRRGRRAAATARKQDANDRDAIKRLARLINCNFRHGDILAGLAYTTASYTDLVERAGVPDDATCDERRDYIRAAAERDVRLFLRRARRLLAGVGRELKYIYAVSDMDGVTGDVTRPHIHMIMSYGDYMALRDLWPHSPMDYQLLRSQQDYTPLATYIYRQMRRIPNAKKYTTSRNLAHPLIDEYDAKDGRELRAPSGAVVLHKSTYDPGQPQYIRYIAPPVNNRRVGKTSGKTKGEENEPSEI